MSAPAPPTIRDQLRDDAYARGVDYLRSPGAASYIGFRPSTLRNWRVEGKGPRYAKVSGEVRYALDDLDAWLAAQFVGGGGDAR